MWPKTSHRMTQSGWTFFFNFVLPRLLQELEYLEVGQRQTTVSDGAQREEEAKAMRDMIDLFADFVLTTDGSNRCMQEPGTIFALYTR
jgi:hypothetical protein